MQRKLFPLACIVFVSTGMWCALTSPTSAGDGSSGIRGTTRSIVISGVPGGPTIGGPASVEFAVAPVEAGKSRYDRAIFVKSDAQGKFQVELRPGRYWLGPKAKALDPINYAPGAVEFSEKVVEVKAGTFISVELVMTGYRP
jgi:hypothetical protein